jgi:hypothetical protein
MWRSWVDWRSGALEQSSKTSLRFTLNVTKYQEWTHMIPMWEICVPRRVVLFAEALDFKCWIYRAMFFVSRRKSPRAVPVDYPLQRIWSLVPARFVCWRPRYLSLLQSLDQRGCLLLRQRAVLRILSVSRAEELYRSDCFLEGRWALH